MNVKPFDLERALAGDPVVTKDGRKVTELHLFETIISEFPLIAVIDGMAAAYNKNGTSPIYLDIFYLHMAPKVKTYYINIYENPRGNAPVESGVFDNEKEAIKWGEESKLYIKTISFEIEE